MLVGGRLMLWGASYRAVFQSLMLFAKRKKLWDHDIRTTASVRPIQPFFSPGLSSMSCMNKKYVCVCVRVWPSLSPHHFMFEHRGVVRSGNLQSSTLVPELSVTARLCPISPLDLIVFSQEAGLAVSSTSCDPCRHKGIQYRGMVTAEREELYT